MQANCTREIGGVSYLRSGGKDTVKLLQLGGHRFGHEIKGWALVDAEDYPTIVGRNWTLMRGYVVASGNGRGAKQFYLHRVLMGLETGDERVVDHINRDTLDNRRSNLRVITRGQNLQNQGLSRASTTGYRGVKKHGNRWVAQCKVAQRATYIGSFDTPEEAAEAAAEYRRLHLPYATD